MAQRSSIRVAISIFTIAGAAAFLAAVTTEQVPQDTDQVAASFERELNREPGPAMPIHRESIARDELYEALNRVHWTQESSSTNAERAPFIPTEGESNEEAND